MKPLKWPDLKAYPGTYEKYEAFVIYECERDGKPKLSDQEMKDGFNLLLKNNPHPDNPPPKK